MKNILESASKIILIMFGLVSSLVFAYVVIKNADTESVVTAVVAIYASCSSSVMTYYFTKQVNKTEKV